MHGSCPEDCIFASFDADDLQKKRTDGHQRAWVMLSGARKRIAPAVKMRKASRGGGGLSLASFFISTSEK
jgi:hypothetical protein